MPPLITMPVGFETKQCTEAKRREVLNDLEVSGRSFLWKLLNKCSEELPCNLRLCPRCMRAMRIKLIQDGRDLLRKAAATTGQDLVAFSIVLTKERTRREDGPSTLRLLHGRIVRQLQRLALPSPILIAGIDVSLNEGLGQRPSWQPQLYGITLANNRKSLEEAFSYKTKHVPKPSYFRNVTDLASALTYSAKIEFVRRASYKDSTGRRNTRKVRLSQMQRLSVALWMADAQTWETMIFQGITRRGSKLVALSSASLSSSSAGNFVKFPPSATVHS